MGLMLNHVGKGTSDVYKDSTVNHVRCAKVMTWSYHILKIIELRLKFHWRFSLGVQLTIYASIGSDNDKPSSDPMLGQFTDAYMRHSVRLDELN